MLIRQLHRGLDCAADFQLWSVKRASVGTWSQGCIVIKRGDAMLRLVISSGVVKEVGDRLHSITLLPQRRLSS